MDLEGECFGEDYMYEGDLNDGWDSDTDGHRTTIAADAAKYAMVYETVTQRCNQTSSKMPMLKLLVHSDAVDTFGCQVLEGESAETHSQVQVRGGASAADETHLYQGVEMPLPWYYKLKCCLFLHYMVTQRRNTEDNQTRTNWLGKAEWALNKCRRAYVLDNRDSETLQELADGISYEEYRTWKYYAQPTLDD